MLKKIKEILNKRKKKKKGFTLVELLAVIVILAVIMVLTIPMVLGNMKEAKQSSFNTIGSTMVKYLEDNYNNCKLGNKNIAKYDDAIFDITNNCELITENLSNNLIINSGYSLEDIDRVEITGEDKGNFGIIVYPKNTGKFNDVNTFMKGTYKTECWSLEPGSNNGYKLTEFHGIEDNGDINNQCTEYVSLDSGFYSIDIPSVVEGKTITTIGNNLFNAVDSISIEVDLNLETDYEKSGFKFNLDKNYSRINFVDMADSIIEIEDYNININDDLFQKMMELSEEFEEEIENKGNTVFKTEKIINTRGMGSFYGIGFKEVFLSFSSVEDYKIEKYNNIDINFSDTLEKIGNNSLTNTTLENIEIPKTVKIIGDYAFSSDFDTGLINSLTFEGSEDGTSQLQTIGESAFSYNQITGQLTIPNSVTTIGDSAFSSNQISSLVIPNSVMSIGSSAFSDNQISSLILPNNITTLWGAFRDNQISSLTIPNTVTTIEDFAFSDNQITSLIIPANVEVIGARAFSDNQISLLTFEGAEDNSSKLKIIDGYAFKDNDLTYLEGDPLVIPGNVTLIEDYAFDGNPNLKEIRCLGDVDKMRFGYSWKGTAKLIK